MKKNEEKELFLKELGIRIRKLRILNGLTQNELATMCGYNSASKNSNINKIEAGKSDLSAYRLSILAKHLGVSAAFLIGEWDKEEEDKYFAKSNAMHLINTRMNADEREELLKGIAILFDEKSEKTEI